MHGLAGVCGLWLSCLQVLISHAPLDLVILTRMGNFVKLLYYQCNDAQLF